MLQRVIHSWHRARAFPQCAAPDGLLAGRFRNRLILHAGDKVAGAKPRCSSVLCQPGAGVTTPLPFSSRHSHVGNVIQRAVGDGLHAFSLAAGTTVHAGGDLQMVNAKWCSA
jgi:hypothetical protein